MATNYFMIRVREATNRQIQKMQDRLEKKGPRVNKGEVIHLAVDEYLEENK